jgi:putative ABC transport system permease protein
MWMHYFYLGLNSLKRNPVLTAITVLILAIGIAASMSTLTVLYIMGGNPIPHKSDRLFVPMLDTDPMDGYAPNEEPAFQFTYTDATNLLKDAKGKRQVAMYGISPAVDSKRKDLPLFQENTVATGSDAFDMFDIQFLHGSGWSKAEDDKAAAVAVIGEQLAKKLFGRTDVVGRDIRLDQRDYRILGVIDKSWRPIPKYYRIYSNSGSFSLPEQIWIPFSNAVSNEYGNSGWTNCNGEDEPGYQGFLKGNCQWIQYWVELERASDTSAFRDYLSSYVVEQKKLGRMPRPENNRLHDLMSWLKRSNVVSDDARISNALSLGFLLVCIVNMMALMLAKFSGRSGEIGVRRALGASRSEIFKQFLVESSIIGLLGAVLGIALSYVALRTISNQSASFDDLFRMDGYMLLLTAAASLLAAIIAGLLPTWRASSVRPALQLKSQ